jgi:hypothetical protein
MSVTTVLSLKSNREAKQEIRCGNGNFEKAANVDSTGERDQPYG